MEFCYINMDLCKIPNSYQLESKNEELKLSIILHKDNIKLEKKIRFLKEKNQKIKIENNFIKKKSEKEERIAKMIINLAENDIQKLKKEIKELKEEKNEVNLCCACKNNICSIVFLCGHASLCFPCFNKLFINSLENENIKLSCPICRSIYNGHIRIYL